MKIRGLVLAGGRSRRFGRDKALESFNGETFLEIAVASLRRAGLKPVVVTRLDVDYSFLDCPVLRDKLPDKGPLGGIYTAMTAFPRTDFLVLTCDMPSVTEDMLSLLLSVRRETGAGAVFRLGLDPRPQPFPGMYAAAYLAQLRKKLYAEQLSMEGFLQEAGPRILDWPDARPFLNVNRTDDLALLPQENRPSCRLSWAPI